MNGCPKRSGHPSLFLGSLFNSPFKKFLKSPLIYYGYTIGSLLICSTKVIKFGAVKGGVPVASSYKMTPRLHKSAV
jgi:hypothetical protein